MMDPAPPPRHGWAKGVFRALLRILPFEMRADYGPEMEETFEAQCEAAQKRGRKALHRLWLRTLLGMLTTAPREHLEMIRQDLHFAFRLMRKTPTLTAVVVVTLALGLGANTLAFSLVEAVLLRPLPYPEGERMVRLHTSIPEEGVGLGGASLLDLEDWRGAITTLDRIAAYEVRSGTFALQPPAERILVGLTTVNLFESLGVKPLHGRLFSLAEEFPGQDRVALLSYPFWQSHFGGDPQVIGRSFLLDGETLDVVGVLAPGVTFPVESPPQLWKPIGMVGDQAGPRDGRWLQALGRRAPSVTLAEAQGEASQVAAALAQRYPGTNRGLALGVQDLHRVTVQDSGNLLWMLWGAVGLVLLIVCANTANLLLSRSAARHQELAVRASLGARPGRLLRQLLSESLLLALVGGGLGILVAALGLRVLPHFAGDALSALPRLEAVSLNPTVLAFAFVLSLCTGLLCGWLPALRLSRTSLEERLRAAGRSGEETGPRGQRFLVMVEVALAVVVMVGAGLLLRSFLELAAVDPGFRPENTLTFRLEPPWQFSFEEDPEDDDSSTPIERYMRERQRMADFYRHALEDLTALPGVRRAAAINRLPLSGNAWAVYLYPQGTADSDPLPRRLGNSRVVTLDYFETLGIPLLSGRSFNAGDTAGSPPVLVINQALADRFWPGESAIGKRITTDNPEEGSPFWAQVVGVVGNLRHIHLDQPTAPVMYRVLPQAREGFFQNWGMDVILYTEGQPEGFTPPVRETMARLAPDTPLFRLRTLEETLHRELALHRFTLILLSLFAGTALLLALLGLYGVLVFTVGRRTRELGLRIALGARRGSILWQVLGHGLVPVVVGLAVGLGIAAWAVTFLADLLYGVPVGDPVAFLGAAALLLAVAMLASYFPARRATRVDPVVALRSD